MRKNNRYLKLGETWFISTFYILFKEYKKQYKVDKLPDDISRLFYYFFLEGISYLEFSEHFGLTNTKDALKFVLDINNHNKISEYSNWYVNQGSKRR